MNTRLILACLTAMLGFAAPASATINSAANRAALGANRTLNWTAMGTLGINVGNSEPVTVPVLQRGGSLRGGDSAALAATLGLSEAALRKANQRLLADYRALIEDEVLQTVATRAEVAAEIAQLLAAFR